MSERIQALAQTLLGKASLEECSIEELQHLTKRFPYFAPAQFLLLQKLASTGAPEAESQKQKAVLYFHNPLQFDYFMDESKYSLVQPEPAPPPVEETLSPEEQYVEWVPSVETFPAEEESTSVQESSLSVNEDEEHTAIPVEAETEPHAAVAEELHEPEHFFVEDIQPYGSEDVSEQTRVAETEDMAETFVPAEFTEESMTESAIEENGENTAPSLENTDTWEEKVSETDVAEIDSLSQTAVSEEQESPLQTAEKSDSASLQAAVPPHSGDSELAFEPYHTVDYFASQGIRISAEELPKDRLGKQLRSFTEWLKMMKRLPASQVAVSPESSAEKTVENLASHSVEQSDVVTEAMAEVWMKQGNREKAMETYNKLSLLNPSKKAYFAAKIENLKGS